MKNLNFRYEISRSLKYVDTPFFLLFCNGKPNWFSAVHTALAGKTGCPEYKAFQPARPLITDALKTEK